MPKVPKRERTVRRAAAREAEKLAVDRERLFATEPGGSSDRPLTAESAAIVESRARSFRCPRCGGEFDVEEHAAVTVRGDRLREARLRCRSCGSKRSLWFRLPVVH